MCTGRYPLASSNPNVYITRLRYPCPYTGNGYLARSNGTLAPHKGTTARNTVPDPTQDRMVNEPFSRSKRSCIPSNPNP